MLVKAMVRTKENITGKSVGYVAGDIIYFWPLNKDHGRLTFNSLIAVVLDLKIPCGSKFDEQPPNCEGCKFNNYKDCDVIKYTYPELDFSHDLSQPRLLRKRKYNIDRSLFVSKETEDIIVNTEKTVIEKEKLLSDALINPQAESIIIEKLSTLNEIVK